MLIQVVECVECRVAEEALILHPVRQALRHPCQSAHQRLALAWWPANQLHGVRDMFILVCSHDEAVELLAHHPRPAGTRLNMLHERCRRDK